MSEHEHHHHHHHKHKRDGASRFKERSLNQIALKRKMEKWLKIAMIVVAVIMGGLVVAAYLFG